MSPGPVETNNASMPEMTPASIRRPETRGHADVESALEPSMSHAAARTAPRDDHDHVDDCGVASFPASDPPSWWSGR
jgi:hypothetical protein